MPSRPTSSPLSISVFFPCYNEEANVEATTRAALAALSQVSSDFEVIIVNDGSTDRTGEIADQLAQEHPRVRAVHNRPNLGYGGALQRGCGCTHRNLADYISTCESKGTRCIFDFARKAKGLVDSFRVERRY